MAYDDDPTGGPLPSALQPQPPFYSWRPSSDYPVATDANPMRLTDPNNPYSGPVTPVSDLYTSTIGGLLRHLFGGGSSLPNVQSPATRPAAAPTPMPTTNWPAAPSAPTRIAVNPGAAPSGYAPSPLDAPIPAPANNMPATPQYTRAPGSDVTSPLTVGGYPITPLPGRPSSTPVGPFASGPMSLPPPPATPGYKPSPLPNLHRPAAHPAARPAAHAPAQASAPTTKATGPQLHSNSVGGVAAPQPNPNVLQFGGFGTARGGYRPESVAVVNRLFGR